MNERTRRILAHILQISGLIGLVLATAVLLGPIQKEIDARMEALRESIVRRLESALGDRRVEFESISPSVFRFVEIRELTIYDREGTSEPLLRIRRVRAYYDILRLFTGDPQRALREIRIENTRFHIDLEADTDLLGVVAGIAAGRTEGGSSPTGNVPVPLPITLSGRNISLEVHFPGGECLVEDVFFSISSKEDVMAIRLQAAVQGSLIEPVSGLATFGASVDVDGTVHRSLRWSDLTLRLAHVTTNLLDLSRQTLHVNVQDDQWEVRKVQDKAPIDLYVAYDMNEQLVHTTFSMDEFVPGSLVHVHDPLRGIRPWLGTALTGRGGLSFSLDSTSLSYAAVLDARVDNELIPFPVDLHGRIEGDDRYVAFSPLHVDTPRGSLHFIGDVDLVAQRPQGRLSIRDGFLTPRIQVGGDFDILRRGAELHVETDNATLGPEVIVSADLLLSLNDNELDFSGTGSLSGTTAAQAGAFVVEGIYTLVPEPLLELGLEAQDLRAEGAYAVVTGIAAGSDQVGSVLSQVDVDLEAYLTTDFHQFSVSIPSATVAGRSDPAQRVSFSAVGNNNRVDVNELAIRWHDFSATGNAGVSLGAAGDLGFRASVVSQEVGYDVVGTYIPGVGVYAEGSHGLRLSVMSAPQGSLAVTAAVADLPVPLSERTAVVTLDAEGTVRDADQWDLLLRELTVSNPPYLPVSETTVSLSGRLNPTEGRLHRIVYEDQHSRVEGSGLLQVGTEEPLSLNGSIQAASPSGSERYEVSLAYSDGEIDGTVVFDGFPLRRAGVVPVQGSLGGSARVAGNAEALSIAGDVRLQEGTLNRDPISVSGSFRLGPELIAVENLRGTYLAHRIRSGSGSYVPATGKLAARADYDGLLANQQVSVDLRLDANLPDPRQTPTLEAMLATQFSGVLEAHAIEVDGETVPPWKVVIRQGEDRTEFSGGPENSVWGHITEEGEFDVTVSDPVPIQFRGTGKIAESQIDTTLTDVQLSLGDVGQLMRLSAFQLTGGVARGDLHITGPVNDPDFYGTLRVREAMARSEFVPEALGPFATSVEFREKELVVREERIPAGPGSALARAEFVMDHWTPREFMLEFRADTAPGVPVRYDFPGVSVDGFAFGTLTVQSDVSAVWVTGDVLVNECVITLASLEPELAKGEAADIGTFVDMRVTTGKRTEFYWPSQSVPILRSFADAGERVTIRYNGQAEEFSIVGDVEMRGGEIYYVERNFYIKEGMLSFQENQVKFDPILTARAEIREYTDEEGEIRIYLVIDESPVSQFSPRFESDPPQPEQRIYAILGENLLADGSTGSPDLASAITVLGDVLGQFALVRSFEQSVRKALGLDLFSIRTQMLQNVLRDRVFGVPYSVTGAGDFGRYLDNTSIFLGKYLGNDLFLEMMLRFQSPDLLAPNTIGGLGGVNIDSEISLEWKTPFFLLEWSLLPKHPEDLFLTDNTLSLSWKFSY